MKRDFKNDTECRTPYEKPQIKTSDSEKMLESFGPAYALYEAPGNDSGDGGGLIG